MNGDFLNTWVRIYPHGAKSAVENKQNGGISTMKKLLTLAVAAAMTLSVAAASATTLKLSEVHAEGYPTTLADQEFARLIEEKTEGRIKVEVYSGGQLYGEETGSIEALQLGDIAFARVSASPVASYVPALNAIQMPYLYKNADHMWAVLDGEIGKDMLAQIEASGSGLVGLCWYDAGARSYYTTKKVASVADMKGLKIRMQNNAMMVDMTNVLGGTGVTGIFGILLHLHMPLQYLIMMAISFGVSFAVTWVIWTPEAEEAKA